jgi:hypothetical protein
VPAAHTVESPFVQAQRPPAGLPPAPPRAATTSSSAGQDGARHAGSSAAAGQAVSAMLQARDRAAASLVAQGFQGSQGSSFSASHSSAVGSPQQVGTRPTFSMMPTFGSGHLAAAAHGLEAESSAGAPPRSSVGSNGAQAASARESRNLSSCQVVSLSGAGLIGGAAPSSPSQQGRPPRGGRPHPAGEAPYMTSPSIDFTV